MYHVSPQFNILYYIYMTALGYKGKDSSKNSHIMPVKVLPMYANFEETNVHNKNVVIRISSKEYLTWTDHVYQAFLWSTVGTVGVLSEMRTHVTNYTIHTCNTLTTY